MNLSNVKYCFADGTVTAAPFSALQREERNGGEVFFLDCCEQKAFSPECACSLQVEMPNGFLSWMAIEHHSEWWCRPTFGNEISAIPDNVQYLLIRQNAGWTALFPLAGDEYTTHLCSVDGQLTLKVYSLCEGLKACKTPILATFSGKNANEVVEGAARLASIATHTPLREARKYPEVFEYLGWCTWDAMEIWVDHAGIMDKCEEFKKKKTPVRWAVLDDMWADIAWTKKLPRFTDHSISFGVMHASKMRDFRADPKRFPKGLDGCIKDVKQYGIQMGVWHPVNGYWSGIEPDSQADKKFASCTRKMENGTILPDFSDAKKAKEYFDIFHSYLKDCGADFVKIDNQSCLRMRYKGTAPVGEVAKNLHLSMEKSVKERFGGAIINCMGMANENLFHRETAVCRCSDDFQPENREWFSKHLLQCAYNGLWQGQFHYNDWDMWWTDDSQALKNSALRAVSGGPIYVSDRIGRTKTELLTPLCFEDGRICRCEKTAVPSVGNLCEDPTLGNSAFLLCNECNGSTVVATFNINRDHLSVKGEICPADFGYDCETVLYEYRSRKAICLRKNETCKFELESNDDFRLFTILPRKKRTVLGLCDKMISRAGVLSETDGGVELYEGGTLAWYDTELHFVKADHYYSFGGVEK